MKIEERQAAGGVTIVAIDGRLDASNSSNLRKRFSELLDASSKFVFDFQKLEFLDSSGLGMIVSCLKSAVERGGNIKIACLQNKPRMIFEITRAHKIFDIYDDVECATASF